MNTRMTQSTSFAPRFPLSVLFVEDNPDDVEISLRVLTRAQLEVRYDVVSTRQEFLSKIRTSYYDVILADYNLGPWTGLEAFELMLQERHDVPFILVTGALGDQKAIECVKRGVTDYILKDQLDRLPVAISRAQEERFLRNEHLRSQAALEESEAKFRALADAIPMATFIEQSTHCHYANQAAERITGYSQEELLAMNFWQLILPDSRQSLTTVQNFQDRDWADSRHELKILTKDGQIRWLDVTVGMFQLHGSLAALITAVDVTHQKRAHVGMLQAIGTPSTKHRRFTW
jgi:PAS domain S-box-containing protein